ncbi:MAG: rhomboid family intramembrane serine protease [Gammaproteobacteria bacterium]|nr:rhomboid family intramembrane serine protease [Gammaproteobacteria bacterium]MDH3480735.1 rhomboid family intramembrane serine protease [Gammaproteobacteria bacterium]
MDEDLRVVFESRNRQSCSDRALVLAAAQLPHQIVDDGITAALVVPAEFSAQAVHELRLYDDENPPARPKSRKKIVYQDAVPGLVGYVFVVSAIAWLAGYSMFGHDWFDAGRVDGELIRRGEWWRTITALTLHSGGRHLIGNLVFGILFGLFAGRLLGSGIAWLAIVAAAATGNAANTLLLESAHRSVGASTAVFAALGLVAGFVWRGQFMAQDRWSYRYGPIVGGLALLMYTGTGGPNTDIGAHLLGFVCGFLTGMLLIALGPVPTDRRSQRVAGGLAMLLVVTSWLVALQA